MYDIEGLATETFDAFHRYSFATLRQFGASFELAATYLKWLDRQNVTGLVCFGQERGITGSEPENAGKCHSH